MADAYSAPRCPGCDKPPMMILDNGHQAFCGSDDCQVLTWDMHDDPAQFKAKAERIEWGAAPEDVDPNEDGIGYQ